MNFFLKINTIRITFTFIPQQTLHSFIVFACLDGLFPSRKHWLGTHLALGGCCVIRDFRWLSSWACCKFLCEEKDKNTSNIYTLGTRTTSSATELFEIFGRTHRRKAINFAS